MPRAMVREGKGRLQHGSGLSEEHLESQDTGLTEEETKRERAKKVLPQGGRLRPRSGDLESSSLFGQRAFRPR